MKRFFPLSLLLIMLVFLGVTHSSTSAAGQEVFIILLQDPPLSRYGGGIEGLAPTDPEVTGDLRLDPNAPASAAYLDYLDSSQDDFVALLNNALGRQVNVHFRYNTVLNGLAVELSAAEAQTVASLPGVARVEEDEERFLLSDAGPEWIGAPHVWDGSATGSGSGTMGEGVVVGIIDTGINHDHPSFAEVGPGDSYVHSNPRGQFYGVCEPSSGAPFCNDKLIGFYDFTGTSPEDTHGHGSHTASTTAGNKLQADWVAPTTTLSRDISGVAPHANIISYKVCITTCPLSAILAAINQATADMVDVVNYSIGGGASNPWEDLDARAYLNARNAGVFVATSAGNSGPGASTIGSPADAPWVMTVGASTHHRKFENVVQNMSGGDTAAPADIAGKSVTSGYGPAPIVYAGDYGDALCLNPFVPGTFDGEIVVCDRGTNARVAKAENVAAGGAGGFVLANDQANGDSTVADAYVIPGVHISHANGVVLKAWLASGSGHTGSISGTLFNEDSTNGDVMASFSSRGPNPSSAGLLKPDVTAPGVDVLAAVSTTDPTAPAEYGVMSGTSMSSPHAAGAAALVRAAHPDWTPDQVKSAIMSTAFTTLPGNGDEVHGVLKEDASTAGDPFDYGAGRVDLTQANGAALVLNESTSNYEAANPELGGDPSSLNIASLANGQCESTCSWTRTVENVLDTKALWKASISAPPGVAISVTPNKFRLDPGQSQTLTIVADVSAVQETGWKFAQVILTANGRQKSTLPETRLPVAINAIGDNVQLTSLYFHGNVHDGCTGNGILDLDGCGGPFLTEDPTLDPDHPAAAFGPVPILLDCVEPRCAVDPSWIWNLDAPTTLSGPMTVEWWIASPESTLLFFDDFIIQLYADGELALEQRVRQMVELPGVPTRLESTLHVPEVTASDNFILVIDPIFINQDQSVFYYDSQLPCPGSVAGACDSQVQMPVNTP